jgi:hypothetical protein
LAHATFNEIQQEISHGFTGVGDREVGRMDERAANWIGGSINSGFAQNIGVGGTAYDLRRVAAGYHPLFHGFRKRQRASGS